MLLYLQLTFQIKYESLEQLDHTLDRIGRLFKYVIIVIENSREKIFSSLQREILIHEIIYPLNFLYQILESNNEITINQRKLLINQISEMFKFMFMTIKIIDSRIGGFKNYSRTSNNNLNATLSAQIPPYNQILYEIMHFYLINSKGEKFINFCNFEADVDFNEKEWVYALCKSNLMKKFIHEKIENENDINKYTTHLKGLMNIYLDNLGKRNEIKSLRIMTIKEVFDNDIYEKTANIMEMYDTKKQDEILLSERKIRQSKVKHIKFFFFFD